MTFFSSQDTNIQKGLINLLFMNALIILVLIRWITLICINDSMIFREKTQIVLFCTWS